MPQNFRLQKENGIFIKTFYGEDSDDSALYELIPILTQIAKEKVKDVRTSLLKFKNEILKKISSNIEKMGLQGKYN
jgi:CTD small phosphatase-like protein 2